MKMIAEYLDHAARFEQMAQQEKNGQFKKDLLKQAAAYRKLAADRAKKLNVGLPPKTPPQSS